MKNVKAYVRTTLTAGLILAAAVLGGCSKSDAGSSAADTAAASSGTESVASADASDSKVTNHQFNWWFDFSPPKGYITTRPTGRCHKHFYWSAIKRYY